MSYLVIEVVILIPKGSLEMERFAHSVRKGELPHLLPSLGKPVSPWLRYHRLDDLE